MPDAPEKIEQDDTEVEKAEGADSGGEGQDEDKPLGPQGESALRAEKEKRKAAQAELRAFKELGLTPEQIAELTRKGKGDGDEPKGPDPDEIRRQAQREVQEMVLRDRVADKIEAKARAFADPEDAVAILLRNSKIDDFIDDGKIDVDAITEALNDLGKNKPHLLAQGKRFQGSGDGGARPSTAKRPESLNAAVHSKMTR